MPDTAVVLTVPNVCPPAGVRTLCQTILTKAEFEALANAVAPGASPEVLRRLATAYAQLLALAAAAREAGVDKDPAVQKQTEFMAMRVLEAAYFQRLRKQAEQLPPDAVERHYRENPAAYEEATIRRVFVPLTLKNENAEAGAAAAKALAEDVRARMAAKEDPDAVQRAVFDAAKLEVPPPNTNVGPRRRGSLPPAHEAEVFALPAGGVSPPFKEGSGYFIYKVEARQMVPLERVRDEIRRALEQQAFEDKKAELTRDSVPEFNEEYFGPAAPPPPPGAGRMPPRRPTAAPAGGQPSLPPGPPR